MEHNIHYDRNEKRQKLEPGPMCSLCKTRFPARTDNIRKLLDSESAKGEFERMVLTTLHAHT